MIKRALIVGINYKGTNHELRGCINDAHNMHRLVLDELGFTQTKLVLEETATTQGILDGLNWLVKDAKPGDVLLFHFSGHGSQVRSNIEPDGLDEIICPVDINWRDRVIKDDHLKAVFSKVPNGVNVTVLLDCCHSGSGLDQTNTLFEQARVQMHQEQPLEDKDGRFMPMPPEVQQYIKEEGLELREFKTSRDVNRSALLIAGCLPHQTAADAFISGQFQGAATYALRAALREGKRTYRDIAEFMSNFMVERNFTQRPQLDGHPSLYEQYFLEPWGTADGQPVETPPPGTWQAPPVESVAQPAPETPAQPEKKDQSYVVAAVVIIAIAALVYLVFV